MPTSKTDVRFVELGKTSFTKEAIRIQKYAG